MIGHIAIKPEPALKYAIAFALRGASKVVRGLKQGLTETERYAVADHVVSQFKARGDPWRLSDEAKRTHVKQRPAPRVCFLIAKAPIAGHSQSGLRRATPAACPVSTWRTKRGGMAFGIGIACDQSRCIHHPVCFAGRHARARSPVSN
jgi:hypothetical protein